MKILFKDEALPQHIPFSRTRTIFSFRNGIFTPIERCQELYRGEEMEMFFSHPNTVYQNLVAEVDGLLPMPASMQDSDFNVVISSTEVDVLTVLDKVEHSIMTDLELMDRSIFLSTDEFAAKFPQVEVIGDFERLFIARDVKILSRNTVFDTTEGVIVVNSGSTIAPFSYIKGCVYIGRNSDVVNARLSHNTLVGNCCRVSGEVSNSLFNDYSYKSHDGFIGCSVIGTWVNFGAMSTTSNLKNNYSDVKLLLPQSIEIGAENELISSRTMKFGSLIGDYVKTAIGTLINCGSVIDVGCNVLTRPEKYTPPMRWCDGVSEYQTARFVKDTAFIVGRKGVVLHESFSKLVELMSRL